MKEDKAATDEAVFGNEAKAYIMSIINQGNADPNVSGSVSTTTVTTPTCPSTANTLTNASTTIISQSIKAKNLLKDILRKAKE